MSVSSLQSSPLERITQAHLSIRASNRFRSRAWRALWAEQRQRQNIVVRSTCFVFTCFQWLFSSLHQLKVHPRKMTNLEQPLEMDRMYDDEWNFVQEEGGENEEVVVKEEEEEETSEIWYDALETLDDQSAGNGERMINFSPLINFYFYSEFPSTETAVKTEEQNESAIDMFDVEFYAIMEQDFSAKLNENETSETEKVSEEHETDSDAIETDEEDYAAFSGEWFVGIHFIL